MKIDLPLMQYYILRGGLAYLNVFIKQSKDFSMNNKVNLVCIYILATILQNIINLKSKKKKKN